CCTAAQLPVLALTTSMHRCSFGAPAIGAAVTKLKFRYWGVTCQRCLFKLLHEVCRMTAESLLSAPCTSTHFDANDWRRNTPFVDVLSNANAWSALTPVGSPGTSSPFTSIVVSAVLPPVT